MQKRNIELPLEIPGSDDIDPDAGWVMDVDLSAETPDYVIVAERESTLPPERVRFTAPARIRRESDDQELEGAVYNLSTYGAACSAPAMLKTGERVWLNFQLGLADEPISLLCEVIWCRDRGTACFFGLHFLTLTPDEESAIRRTVSERSEGRAGDWPLPVVPEAEPNQRRGPSPILAAAAGMAAGITLALVLSVVPSALFGGSAPAIPMESAPRQAEMAESRAQRSGTHRTAAEATASEQPAESSREMSSAATPPREATHTAEVQREAAGGTEPPREAVHAAELPREQVGAARSSQEPGELSPRLHSDRAPEPEGDLLRPLGTDDGVELALLTDGDVIDHVSFWLDSPKRLVVDVFGRKNGFARNSYRVDHPLVQRLRVGDHPGKVRFVIDTADNLSSVVSTKPVGASLLVKLHRG